MSAVLLQLLWVAAHHGLRKQKPDARSVVLWGYVHDVAAALGYPPAPG